VNPWNFPWNSMKNSMKNFMENSMKNSMEFHGNSMENFHGKNPSNVYEKFHGIPWNSINLSFMKFHGI
jgi:hypothetical protein